RVRARWRASGSVREFVRAWPAKTEQDKDAGRPRTQRYVADRGRSNATVCRRTGTQLNLRTGPLLVVTATALAACTALVLTGALTGIDDWGIDHVMPALDPHSH